MNLERSEKMNTMLWLVAGGTIAAAAFQLLQLNAARGLAMSLVIGIGAAYFGGSILAPLLYAPDVGLNLPALLIACATAAAAVYASDAISEHYGT
jgi:uncharacterized membrane protein YeaQ/YmgE (transglycosylase-associated protein family)